MARLRQVGGLEMRLNPDRDRQAATALGLVGDGDFPTPTRMVEHLLIVRVGWREDDHLRRLVAAAKLREDPCDVIHDISGQVESWAPATYEGIRRTIGSPDSLWRVREWYLGRLPVGCIIHKA